LFSRRPTPHVTLPSAFDLVLSAFQHFSMSAFGVTISAFQLLVWQFLL
jgi:hypothetical protein